MRPRHFFYAAAGLVLAAAVVVAVTLRDLQARCLSFLGPCVLYNRRIPLRVEIVLGGAALALVIVGVGAAIDRRPKPSAPESSPKEVRGSE